MEDKIKPLYHILLLFEACERKEISEADYLAYLNRISVQYLGMGEYEIYHSILGLKELGCQASHKSVKSICLHMTNSIKERA